MADESLETINTPPGNFKWTNENIPLIDPEYFVYDNSDGSSWEKLKAINAYPVPKDNNSSSSIAAEDNFNTHNNITYSGYFEHKQGLIRPIKDQSLDGWYDVGLKSVMFNNGVPYTTPNFQRTIYVWYLKGDGTDYPYDGHTGYVYPGQEHNFAYRYNDLEKALVKSGNIIKIKGNTPSFRYGNAKDGFFVRLNNPNERCNCIAKIDLGLIETTGHRWHYQGFTLVCKGIFSKYPTGTINLDIKGDEVELDITSLIDVNIDWRFSLFEFISSDVNACTVETDWISDENNVDFGNKPNYIRLKGNPDVLDQVVSITMRARPVNTTYTEEVTFKVRVKQLYNKDTVLEVTPKHIITMVGVETPYEVRTDASSYTVSTDNKDLVRLYKGKIQGMKQGTGVLTFKAQAPLSRVATVKIPFTVNKYIPDPVIETPEFSISIEEGVLRETSIVTNVPKANIKITTSNDKVVLLENNLTWEDLEQDVEFPSRKCTFSFRGLTPGTASIIITGYITEGDVVSSKSIAVTVTEQVIPPEPPTTDDTGEFGVMSKTDAYLAFHHQREGVMTYLKSTSRNIPENNLEQEVSVLRRANKIYIVPEVTDEDIRLNGSEVFHLALVEDLVNTGDEDNGPNPNYLDYVENYNPVSGFAGNDIRDKNYWVNRITGERFVKDKLVDNTIRWIGDKGTTVGVIDVNRDGISPAPHEISRYYGLRALKDCYKKDSDNYGNYVDEHGGIWVYIPLHYVAYEAGSLDATKYLHGKKIYWPLTMNHTNYSNYTLTQDYVTARLVRDENNNIIDLNSNAALKKKLRLPAAFINKGKILPGLFIRKYYNSPATTIGTATYKNTTNRYGLTNVTGKKFTSATNVNNNTNVLKANVGDDIWSSVFKVKDLAGKTKTTFTTRMLADISFNTIYIRHMLSDLISYNVTESLYTTSNYGNSWLVDDGSKPFTSKTVAPEDQYDRGYSEIEQNGVAYSNKLLHNTKYSHNGKKSGIYGLSDGNLELVIGAYMVPTFTVSGGNITKTVLAMHTASQATDFRTLTTSWVSAVTNLTAIPALDKVHSSVANTIVPTAMVNNKLLSTVADTKYPLMMKYDNNILTKYASIETDVNVPKLNNNTTIGYYSVNIGCEGAGVATNSVIKRTNYYERDYNSISRYNVHMDHLNTSNAITSFFVSKSNVYTATELRANFSYYMVPLFGGNLKYTATNGVIDVTNEHHDSVTWYRVGFDLGQFFVNNKTNITMNVVSRFVIMPDMDAIKRYVDAGTYVTERNNEIATYGDVCGILSTKQANTNKWEGV